MVSTTEENVFKRWNERNPDLAWPLGDEAVILSDELCRECGDAYAWLGYGGLCGWCEPEELHKR